MDREQWYVTEGIVVSVAAFLSLSGLKVCWEGRKRGEAVKLLAKW